MLLLAYKLRRWGAPVLEHPIRALIEYIHYFVDRHKFIAMGGSAPLTDAYPCLYDRTRETPIDPYYFYQAVWGIREIFDRSPSNHVDVGSDVKFVGMLSAITRVTFVDIRPLAVSVENLECLAGSILSLPFSDQSIKSISSFHVIEHIGLGRYGDPIDPAGTALACRELMRVVAPGGRLYLTVPVGRSRTQFNGQNVLSVKEVVDNFNNLNLIKMAGVNALGQFVSNISPDNAETELNRAGGMDFSLGCFIFERKSAKGKKR